MALRQAAVYVIVPVDVGDYVKDQFAPDEQIRIREFRENGVILGTRIVPGFHNQVGEVLSFLGRLVVPNVGGVADSIRERLVQDDIFAGPLMQGDVMARPPLPAEQRADVPLVLLPFPKRLYDCRTLDDKEMLSMIETSPRGVEAPMIREDNHAQDSSEEGGDSSPHPEGRDDRAPA